MLKQTKYTTMRQRILAILRKISACQLSSDMKIFLLPFYVQELAGTSRFAVEWVINDLASWLGRTTISRQSSNDWDFLLDEINSVSQILRSDGDFAVYSQDPSFLDLQARTYEYLYGFVSLPALDVEILAKLDPLVRLYWEHLITDSASLSNAQVIAELLAVSLTRKNSGYDDDDMDMLSHAFPVKGLDDFVKCVASNVPEPPIPAPGNNIAVNESSVTEVANQAVNRLSDHIKQSSSRIEIASMLTSVLYVYDSMVKPGYEFVTGLPLMDLCSSHSEFIDELVLDLRGAYTVRQRISLERFCLGSLSLKTRYMTLFVPHIQQSYMVSKNMRKRTRIQIIGTIDDVEATLRAVEKISREQMLAGDVVVEYKSSTLFGTERSCIIDESEWLNRFLPKMVKDTKLFDVSGAPLSSVSRPDLYVSAGKIIALALIRETLAIDLNPSVYTRLLAVATGNSDYGTGDAIDALVYGIFSILPREDVFRRFFYNENELDVVFSGTVYNKRR